MAFHIRRNLWSVRENGEGLEEQLPEFHDTHPASFTRSNFRVTIVDGIVELIEALSVVAILAPLARSRQEAVLTFSRPNDDPHSVPDP